ncbi:MAG: MerR family transcriptional regulator [Flavisolibacter sp.]
MNRFSISELSRFSGIQSHTIRIWEKRYNALQPMRSEGNTRYYDGEQLRRLLNIVSLMKVDRKVSELARLPDEKLNKLVSAFTLDVKARDHEEYFISQLIAAGMEYNESHFEKLFSHCLLRYGLPDAYKKIILPLLNRVGLMWTDSSIPPAAEHFISNILRQKLYTAIDALPPVKSSLPPWILFLPEEELHEIGLLFAHYLIRQSGQPSIYLGANMPLSSIKEIINSIQPGKILIFLVHNDDPLETTRYLQALHTATKKPIFIAGHPELISQVEKHKKIKWLRSVEDLEKEVEPNSV